MKNIHKINQHIYITSDEEIKEGDWQLSNDKHITIRTNSFHESDKKIILTTDKDLIKDGVQAIDDEFLQWFVQNPSCEEVEVVGDDCYYEIIIPKEEPNQIKCYCGHTTTCDCSPIESKQQTVEEIRKYAELSYYDADEVNAFVNGAKWMQDKNKYSEEEVKTMFNRFTEFISHHDIEEWQNWIDKQFKKK